MIASYMNSVKYQPEELQKANKIAAILFATAILATAVATGIIVSLSLYFSLSPFLLAGLSVVPAVLLLAYLAVEGVVTYCYKEKEEDIIDWKAGKVKVDNKPYSGDEGKKAIEIVNGLWDLSDVEDPDW